MMIRNRTKTDAQLLEELNDAFIVNLTEMNRAKFGRYVRSINEQIIRQRDSITRAGIQRIIEQTPMEFESTVEMGMLLSALTILITTERLDTRLAPIIALVGMYSIMQPASFVKRMRRVQRGTDLTPREKQARAHWLAYQAQQKAIKKTASREIMQGFKRTQLKAKSNIYRDIKKMQKQGIAPGEMRAKLMDKYVTKSRVDSALDTEVHEQVERSKHTHSKAMGYERKTWKTQGDERVRVTTWHSNVANAEIPIDDEWRIGGMRGAYPGDPRLPIGERINCRCYLVYH